MWCCAFSFIFICQCFSFYWCCIFIWFLGYFTMSLALHPGFSDPWRSPPALSSTPTTFDCLFFFIYRKCYGFEWAFFTHRRFLPHTPSRHFGTTFFYQSFTGSLLYILDLLYILALYLCISILQKFYLWLKLWKDQQLHYSAAMKNKAAHKLITNQTISVYLNCSLKKYIT